MCNIKKKKKTYMGFKLVPLMELVLLLVAAQNVQMEMSHQ